MATNRMFQMSQYRKDLVNEQEFYIHYHNSAVDRKEKQTMDRIAKSYFLQKSKALLRYSDTLRWNLLKNNSLQDLNEITALGEGTVIQELNKNLEQLVQAAIDEKGVELESLGDDVGAFKNKYRQMFNRKKSDFETIQKFFQDSIELFNQMNQSTALLVGLAKELQDTSSKYNSLEFANFIQDFLLKNEKIMVNNQKAYRSTQVFLETIVKRLKKGSTEKTKSFSARKMDNLIQSLFNEGAAEAKVAEIMVDMREDSTEDIIDTFLTGVHKRIAIGKDGQEHQVKIKPDVIVPGLRVEYSKDNTTMSIKLDGKASVKTYKTSSANKYGFGIGSRYLIDDILQTMNFNKRGAPHWVNNTLLYSKEGSDYYYAGVIKQYIDLLISGTGKKSLQSSYDSSNLFVANGQVYSMYDIIKFIAETKNVKDVLNATNYYFTGARPTQGAWVNADAEAKDWKEYAKERSQNAYEKFKKIKYHVGLKNDFLRYLKH